MPRGRPKKKAASAKAVPEIAEAPASKTQPKAAPKAAPKSASDTPAVTPAKAEIKTIGDVIRAGPVAEPVEPPSPTVTGLKKVVDAISHGKSLDDCKDSILLVATHQHEKSAVVQSYLRQIDFEKVADLESMEHDAMRMIKRAARNDTLTLDMALVVWKLCRDQLPELRRNIEVDAQAVDSTSVVNKIEQARQASDAAFEKRWEQTTPQGRELIRRRLWEMKESMRRKTAQTQVEAPPADTDEHFDEQSPEST